MTIQNHTTAAGEDLDISPSRVTTDSDFSKSATTILHWNGEYQRPPMTVTKSKISIHHHKNVSKVQLRNVAGGGVYLLGGGINIIEPGNYVLSLHGSTYPEAFIWATVYYS